MEYTDFDFRTKRTIKEKIRRLESLRVRRGFLLEHNHWDKANELDADIEILVNDIKGLLDA